jgi:hypothetical protein
MSLMSMSTFWRHLLVIRRRAATYMSIGRTGRCSLRERPAATAMRIAWSPSRAVHGLAISPRATRRNVISSS